MTLRCGFLLALFTVSFPALSHEHVTAGARSKTPGSPLVLANAADYADTSGYVFGLDAGDEGTPYAGYFYTGDLVLAALAGTPPFGGPEPLAAALGSHIQAVLETVSGPKGATLGFWETTMDDVDSTAITWSEPVGLERGTHRIDVSETDGSPGSDPYGHRHGRLFSVTQPGFYQVGFRFVDSSTNGPAGGPIHTPSERFYLNLQAGLTLAGVFRGTNDVRLVFAAPSNLPDTGTAPATQYQIESSPTLGAAANWQPVGAPVTGDDHLHTNSIPNPPTARFFRLTSIGGQ
jgi:hypothetical protein